MTDEPVPAEAFHDAAEIAFDYKAEEAARINSYTALEVRKHMGLLTEEEVAAILRLNSIGTLATWRSQGTGPASVKLGKRVYYTVNHLLAWVNSQDNKQNAPAVQVAA